MSLEAINTWAQLIAAIGVICSLFYLGVQIRQNTRSMRAVVVDSLAQSFADLVRPMAQDIVVMRAFAAAASDWTKASDDDRARALPLFFATFKLFENAWFQQHQGTLDPEQWEGWDPYIRLYFHQPGVKAWWQSRRKVFAAGFRDYLETSEPIDDLPSIDRLIRGEI